MFDRLHKTANRNLNATMSTPKFQTIDDYIASFPEDIKQKLKNLRKIIHEELPHAEEAISYNMPSFTVGGIRVIYFSAWKKHISLYPFTNDMLIAFPETHEYDTSGKGTIQFPYTKPIPVDLIRKIVRHRLGEIEVSKK